MAEVAEVRDWSGQNNSVADLPPSPMTQSKPGSIPEQEGYGRSIMLASIQSRAIEILERFVADGALLTLGAVDRLGAIPVQLTAAEPQTGSITLLAHCDREELDEHLLGERLALDVELAIAGGSVRCLTLEDVDCDWQTREPGVSEIRCLLSGRDTRAMRPSGIRVPFVLGMSAEMTFQPFVGGERVGGKLLDLSLGGCRLQMPVQMATMLEPGAKLAAATITFPNGETLSCAAEIRHLRPLGSMAYLAVGLSFLSPEAHVVQSLRRVIDEAERDLAWRLGVQSRGSRPAELFQGSVAASDDIEVSIPADPYIQGMRDICRKLYNIVICLRVGRWFPADLLDTAAKDLMLLIESDRARCLFSLSCLETEPLWMRQAVEVATVLGEWLQDEPDCRDEALEAMAGALLHSLGQPLLQGPALPLLGDDLAGAQRKLLDGHVLYLLDKLRQVGWEPAPLTLDVMLHINEHLDGSGYPRGRSAAELSTMARRAAVVERARQLIRGGAGQRPLAPREVWRWLFDHPEKFDRECVVRLAQRHGVYPIGSLVKFSQGFLGWVRDHDDKRLPSQVVVARNLAFPETTLKTVLRGTDLEQLGEPQRVVHPEDYGVTFPGLT